jgi:hypothetical protein
VQVPQGQGPVVSEQSEAEAPKAAAGEDRRILGEGRQRRPIGPGRPAGVRVAQARPEQLVDLQCLLDDLLATCDEVDGLGVEGAELFDDPGPPVVEKATVRCFQGAEETIGVVGVVAEVLRRCWKRLVVHAPTLRAAPGVMGRPRRRGVERPSSTKTSWRAGVTQFRSPPSPGTARPRRDRPTSPAPPAASTARSPTVPPRSVGQRILEDSLPYGLRLGWGGRERTAGGAREGDGR